MSEEYDEYLERSSQSGRKVVWAIIAGLIVIAAIFFVFQNTEDVDVDFLFLSGRAPLYLVIVISMVLGSLLTLIAVGLRRRSRKRARRHDD